MYSKTKHDEVEDESLSRKTQRQHKTVTASMLTKTPSDVMQNDEVEHQIKSKPSTSILEGTTSHEKPLISTADETPFGNLQKSQ